jgi:Trk K+ transport system NAD-binding subunit
MAQWLGVTSEQATGAVIVGCNPLSLLIARLLRERGEGVVLIDTDAGAIASAQEAGFQGFASSALDTKVLEEAGLGTAGTFLAMTNNSEVNQVLAQRAAEEFQPPRVLAVFAEPQSGASKVQQAFAPEVSLKTWNRYLEDGAIKLGVTMLRDPELLFQQAHLQALMRAEELVPLLVEREDRLLLAPAVENWEVGDRIIYLLHDPRPKLLRQLSGGNKPLVAEKLPRVEEIPIAVGLEGGEAID